MPHVAVAELPGHVRLGRLRGTAPSVGGQVADRGAPRRRRRRASAPVVDGGVCRAPPQSRSATSSMKTKSRVISPSSYSGMDLPPPGQLGEQRHDAGVGVGQRLAGAVDVLEPQHRQRHVVGRRPRRRARAPGRAWSAPYTLDGRRGVVGRGRLGTGSPSGKSHCAASSWRGCAAPGWKSVPSVRRQVPSPYTARLLVSSEVARGRGRPGSARPAAGCVPTTLTRAVPGALARATGRCPVSAPGGRRRRAAVGEHLVPGLGGRRRRRRPARPPRAAPPDARGAACTCGCRLVDDDPALGASRPAAARARSR